MKTAAAFAVLCMLLGCYLQDDKAPPPPPPDKAFVQWCADHPAESVTCERLQEFASRDASVTNAALAFFGLAAASLVFWVSMYSRQAYLGGRFIEECGGYEAAARVLARLEADNEAMLSGGLSAAVFTQPKRKKP